MNERRGSVMEFVLVFINNPFGKGQAVKTLSPHGTPFNINSRPYFEYPDGSVWIACSATRERADGHNAEMG